MGRGRDRFGKCLRCRFSVSPCLCFPTGVAIALRTLAANLAVGGALCASFYAGYGEGFGASGEGCNGEYAPKLTSARLTAMAQDTTIGGYDATWKPGCGRAWGGGER